MYGYQLDKKIKDFLEDIKSYPSEKNTLIIYPSDIPNSKIEFHYEPAKFTTLSCIVYGDGNKSGCYSVIKKDEELSQILFNEKLIGFLNFFKGIGQGEFLPIYKEFFDFYSYWWSNKS